MSDKAKAKVVAVEIPADEAAEIEDDIAEEEWESDWGAVIWCTLLCILVVGCLYGTAFWIV